MKLVGSLVLSETVISFLGSTFLQVLGSSARFAQLCLSPAAGPSEEPA